ncbi:MAG: hypothetical protein U9N42_03845 [Campylobacterota bacterium]|nr:hypothetical protein [Campylobacterota bacterium]
MEVNNSNSANALYASYSSKSSSESIKVSEKVEGNMSEREVTIKSDSQELSVKVFDYQAAAMEEFFGNGESSRNNPLNVGAQEFKSFLSDIGYDGPPIAELSQEEATELVSEDGFFGVKETSERIANFVINGAGDDEDMLRAGRAGILEGFEQAKQISGGKLPDISYQTIDKAVEMIDKKMNDLGYSIINEGV